MDGTTSIEDDSHSCQLCDVEYSSSAHRRQHVRGKAHAKRVARARALSSMSTSTSTSTSSTVKPTSTPKGGVFTSLGTAPPLSSTSTRGSKRKANGNNSNVENSGTTDSVVKPEPGVTSTDDQSSSKRARTTLSTNDTDTSNDSKESVTTAHTGATVTNDNSNDNNTATERTVNDNLSMPPLSPGTSSNSNNNDKSADRVAAASATASAAALAADSSTRTSDHGNDTTNETKETKRINDSNNNDNGTNTNHVSDGKDDDGDSDSDDDDEPAVIITRAPSTTKKKNNNEAASQWKCAACKYSNYNSRHECYKCHQPRPSSTHPMAARAHGDPITIHLSKDASLLLTRGSKEGKAHGHPNGSQHNSNGDWSCHQCHASNFASRHHCYKCHAPKVVSLSRSSAPPPVVAGSYGNLHFGAPPQQSSSAYSGPPSYATSQGMAPYNHHAPSPYHQHHQHSQYHQHQQYPQHPPSSYGYNNGYGYGAPPSSSSPYYDPRASVASSSPPPSSSSSSSYYDQQATQYIATYGIEAFRSAYAAQQQQYAAAAAAAVASATTGNNHHRNANSGHAHAAHQPPTASRPAYGYTSTAFSW
jgi:hypothetical protein